MDDALNKAIQEYAAKLTNEKEYLIYRYITKTGFNIQDVCIVERQIPEGRIYYPDLKKNYFEDEGQVD